MTTDPRPHPRPPEVDGGAGVSEGTAAGAVDSPEGATGVLPGAGVQVLTGPQRSRDRARRRWGLVLAGAGLVLLALAGALLLVREPAVTAAPLGTVAPRPVPAESGDLRPGGPVRLRHSGIMPVGLELPARRTTAPVVPVGTGPDGGLQIPDPPQTVGWWAPGALAGSGTGTVIVAGHVDSRLAGIGMMAVLPQLTVGEPVLLRGADGRAVRYRVVARREFRKAALPADTFARTGSPRLVLITCGGRFDPTVGSYEDNIVVYADPARP